jgi:hypothetical protein
VSSNLKAGELGAGQGGESGPSLGTRPAHVLSTARTSALLHSHPRAAVIRSRPALPRCGDSLGSGDDLSPASQRAVPYLPTSSGPSFGASPSWPCSPPWPSAATARFSTTKRRVPNHALTSACPGSEPASAPSTGCAPPRPRDGVTAAPVPSMTTCWPISASIHATGAPQNRSSMDWRECGVCGRGALLVVVYV